MNRIATLLGTAMLAVLTFWAFSSSSSGVAGPSGVRVNPGEVYNPVTAGERLPEGFRQLLPRDAIAPVYAPEFVAGNSVGWPANAQVIGVVAGDIAKAYPVSFLNRREMVIDSVNGIPILVTW